MKLSDFTFDLPPDLIARYPLPERSASRLMHVNGAQRQLTHKQFSDVLHLVEPGDLLVFNDTKVIPARLFGRKATGGLAEMLIERILDEQCVLAQVRVSKSLRPGDLIFMADDVQLEVMGRREQFYQLRYTKNDRTVLEVVEALGEIPLPPYMHRSPEESDKERYQTVYATYKGSVAAPTAGLHFDHDLLQALRDKGVEMGYLTLHIGAGTFAPVRVENLSEHKMHAEYVEISAVLCEQIAQTKARGKRVICVGTTSLRALESASQSGKTVPYSGDTSIFIFPGYQFRCVDALITNLHLPGSTLLMLVCAFGGQDLLMHAYREAVAQAYRFYSYGDAMFILPERIMR